MAGTYAFDRCEVRPGERQLLVEGRPAALGARAFDVLVALIERRDRVVGKAELFDTVWPGLVVEENNLQVQVSSLRKLLGPNAIATVPGRGYRFVAALDAAGTEAIGASVSVPNNLTQLPTRFIGREAELAGCTSLLQGTRLLTLSGIGGCGKTRLAQELAQRQLGAFPDGVWFVDLAPVQEAQGVAATLAGTLGVQPGRVTDHLKARRTLIVMDNCEHVVGAAVSSIGSMLQNCGALKIVATSREVLGMAGEQVFAVRSLSLPASSDLEDMRRSEAVRLFVDHARLVVPDFEVDERNARAIAEICRRLDGIALAIELAAARVRVLSVDDIRARLDDRFRLLTGGNRALPRHQTLHATMQWSHDHLTPAEQTAFRRLGVFAGGCTLAAAAAVVGDEQDEYEALERLTALHDKSLLMVDRDTRAQPRYRMLETVRQYAEERLNEAGEGDAIRTRHLQHFVALAERAEPDLAGARWPEWYDVFRGEQENLLAAHSWCPNAPDGAELALRLTGASWRYWANTAQPERGYRLAESALSLTEVEEVTPSHCKTLFAKSSHALRLGRYAELETSAERSLAMAREIAAPDWIIDGLCMLGIARHTLGREAEALASFGEARDRARASGDEIREGRALIGTGEVLRIQGESALAERDYREAIRLARRHSDLRSIAVGLSNLAALLIATGRLAEAKAMLVDHATLRREASAKVVVPCVLDTAAGLAAALGEHHFAARLHGAMQRNLHESGTRHEPIDEAFVQEWMNRSRTALGDAAFDATTAEAWGLDYAAALAEMDAWLGPPAGDESKGTATA